MAVDRVPVLKRCRSLGMDPIYLGIDKKSNRESKRANKKLSEYGMHFGMSRNIGQHLRKIVGTRYVPVFTNDDGAYRNLVFIPILWIPLHSR